MDAFLCRYMRLKELITDDEGYLFYLDNAALCKRRLLQCKKIGDADFQQMLGYYEECVRSMADRVAAVACLHMEFTDEEKDRGE